MSSILKNSLKLIILLILFALLCGCSSPSGNIALPGTTSGNIASSSAMPKNYITIGYFKFDNEIEDFASKAYIRAGYDTFCALAEKEGWSVLDGSSVAVYKPQNKSLLLRSTQALIEYKVDAIVVATGNGWSDEAIGMCREAGIPYFALSTHPPINREGLCGYAGYDRKAAGYLAGQNALKSRVKALLPVEGHSGSGTVGYEVAGFVEAYRDAGKMKTSLVDIAPGGGKDLSIVALIDGQWDTTYTYKNLNQYSLPGTKKGEFDAVFSYDENMMEGVLQYMADQKIKPESIWLGCRSAGEKAMKWVREGMLDIAINNSPCLEADLCFQQVKAYLEGKPYRKYVWPYLIAIDKSNVDTVKLIPNNPREYLKGRDAGAFIYDLNDPSMTDIKTGSNSFLPKDYVKQ